MPSCPEKIHTAHDKKGVRLRTDLIFFLIPTLLVVAVIMILEITAGKECRLMEMISERYSSAQTAVSDMSTMSDDQTYLAHFFVITGEPEYVKAYCAENRVTEWGEQAIRELKMLPDGGADTVLADLNRAISLSNELVQMESYAMRLTLEAGDYDRRDVPEEMLTISVTEEDSKLSEQEQKLRAQELFSDRQYRECRKQMRESIALCREELTRSGEQKLTALSERTAVLLKIQTALMLALLMWLFGALFMVRQMIQRPLAEMTEFMHEQKPSPVTGIKELRDAARTYNKMLEENRIAQEKLSRQASHDALTGLFNRGAYDMLMESADQAHIALILADVDGLKQINDTYGHAVGDRILKRVAKILQNSFRSVDVVCRIGGDEFAVIMTRANSSMRQLLANKIIHVNELLKQQEDDLPCATVSMGAAFSDRDNPKGDIFGDADAALYRAKKAGGGGHVIWQ